MGDDNEEGNEHDNLENSFIIMIMLVGKHYDD